MISPAQLAPLLVKPSLETRFHIDFEWWGQHGRALRIYLQSHLCEEHKSEFASDDERGEMADWMNPETGEVQSLDPIRYALSTHCSQQDRYLTLRTSLVDAIFRVFLSNGNQPLTPRELAQHVRREGKADVILRTLSGRRVYRGLRPVAE